MSTRPRTITDTKLFYNAMVYYSGDHMPWTTRKHVVDAWFTACDEYIRDQGGFCYVLGTERTQGWPS